jgi:paraquat-inducible protein B
VNQKQAPKPKFTKNRWTIAVIWLIPLGAAVAAGIYLYDYLQEHGPTITITFNDVNGLKGDNTPIQRNGVQIGQVSGVGLAPDKQHVLIRVVLQRAQSDFARQGAVYWIVRPDLSGGSLNGLNTVVSGAYIEATPGTGAPATEFNGLDKPPITTEGGLQVILYADRLQHLQPNSPVYYRGLQVGAVQQIELSDDSTRVKFHVLIQKHFSPLVRPGSQFWLLAGIDLKGSVFSGLKLEMGPLRALLAGGIEFATPDMKNPIIAKDGAEYTLNDEAKDEWTKWNPQIALLPTDGSESPKVKGNDVRQAQAELGEQVEGK